MKVISRIAIRGGRGDGSDKAYDFVIKGLKRRYGNSVTFALDFEVNDVINQLKEAGFEAIDDDYRIYISELKDYVPGQIIYLEGMIGDIPMKVIEVKPDEKYRQIAKLKYAKYPNKRKSVWIRIPSEDEIYKKLSQYGEGLLEAYKKENASDVNSLKQ